MNASSKSDSLLLVLSATLLISLTGCVGYVERPPTRTVYVAPPAPVYIEQEDYVYYPGYQMYYGSRSRQYYYQQGSSWVARPAPVGISVDVLLSSPSVRMDFHDRPDVHHAQVIRSYPKNWKQPGPNHGQRPDQRKNSKDDRRDDNRR